MRLNGFVFMHRSIINWEWYKDIPTRLVFEHLIYTANFKDTNWKGIEIKRGQVITGRKQLADDNGLTERKVRTALEKLQSTGEITIETTNKYSLITIVNYDFYQSELSTATNKPTNNRPTDDQQPTNNRPQRNNDNKGIREEGKKDSQSSLSPSEVLPLPKSAEEVKEYCIQMVYTKVDPVYFFNYYEERNWMTGGKPVENWHALVKWWNDHQRETAADEPEQEQPKQFEPETDDLPYKLWSLYCDLSEDGEIGDNPIPPANLEEMLNHYKDYSGFSGYITEFYTYFDPKGWRVIEANIRDWKLAFQIWVQLRAIRKEYDAKQIEIKMWNKRFENLDSMFFCTEEERNKVKEKLDWRAIAAR